MDPAIAAAYTGRIGAVGVVADRKRLDALVASGELPDTAKFLVAAVDLPTDAPDRSALPSLFPYPPSDDDPMTLCHTSGTTGPPKPAVFAHPTVHNGPHDPARARTPVRPQPPPSPGGVPGPSLPAPTDKRSSHSAPKIHMWTTSVAGTGESSSGAKQVAAGQGHDRQTRGRRGSCWRKPARRVIDIGPSTSRIVHSRQRLERRPLDPQR
ncbi:hypothetical protein [Actinokineospora cianjurensis]|uniref:hypothetical protein n=1 Tax=Actinokineospora cianjurensis TaxID=585224 RepID=UPI003CCC762F